MENMSKEKIMQNLIDAGCDNATITDFFKITGSDKFSKQLMLLRRHRNKLLDGIHKWQYKIDCLDYLMRQIEEQSSKTGKANAAQAQVTN